MLAKTLMALIVIVVTLAGCATGVDDSDNYPTSRKSSGSGSRSGGGHSH